MQDGRWGLAYRYNPAGGELNAFAISTTGVAGPYACVANVTAGAPGDEDPFLWQEPDDGSLHMVYHNRQFGYHAFAPVGGARWAVSPTRAHFFTTSVRLDDGRTLELGRRERPELRFDAAGAPAVLYTGVQANDTTCFVLAQTVGT